jgi:sugar lactone lactonase YvrE
MDAELIWDAGCQLGEGALWAHDLLWFFDITGKRLYRCDAEGHDRRHWDLPVMASAAAQAGDGTLLIATELEIARFDPVTGALGILADLEADTPQNRSNDGRADRHGGFWIGTMGKAAEPAAGAIYRYARRSVTRLREGVSIPNAICFSPDGGLAYFADTARQVIWKWPLDDDGDPLGEPQVFRDLSAEGLYPDGAVIDAEGAMWLALWGAGRAIRILPDGRTVDEVRVGVPNVTCPALGPDGRLYLTTARQGLTAEQLADHPASGGVFRAVVEVPGLPGPELRLR